MNNKAMDCTALTLTIIGAVNWGLIGFFNFNLVAFLFGKDELAVTHHLCSCRTQRIVSHQFLYENGRGGNVNALLPLLFIISHNREFITYFVFTVTFFPENAIPIFRISCTPHFSSPHHICYHQSELMLHPQGWKAFLHQDSFPF